MVVVVGTSMLRVDVQGGVERERVGGAGGCHSGVDVGAVVVIGMRGRSCLCGEAAPTRQSQGKDRMLRSS